MTGDGERVRTVPVEGVTGWQLARAATHTSIELESAETEAWEDLPDPEVAALQSIPEVYRIAVHRADAEGYAYKEMAALAGAPIGTVTSRLHRSRRQVRARPHAYARAR